MKRVLHITHNDADAVGCDVLLRLYFKDKYHDEDSSCIVNTFYSSNSNISSTIETVVDEYINHNIYQDDEILLVISDISPNEDSAGYELIKNIMTNSNDPNYKNIDVWMFDHHKTNPFYRLLDDIKPNCEIHINISNEGSAAMIMYQYLNSILTDPSLISHMYIEKFIIDISRYDTWKWRENPSEFGGEDAVANVLRYTNIDTFVYDIVDYLYYLIRDIVFGKIPMCTYNENAIGYQDYLPEKYREINRFVLDEYNKYISELDFKLAISKSGEYLYGLIICDNGNINMSLVTDYINRTLLPKTLDYIVILYPSNRALSFRTIQDTVDVARIAKRCYGGGGHQKAAGARVDIPTFTSFLTEYWTSPKYITFKEYLSEHPRQPISSDLMINIIKSLRSIPDDEG